MDEPKPLAIEFVVDRTRGVYFGWNLDREKINPYSIPIWLSASLELVGQWERDGTLVDRVRTNVVNFFSGAMAADLVIPKNYPFCLYEKGKEAPCSKGRLRE